MVPKFLPVLEMCIENGLNRGYQKAFKHSDNPDESTVTNKQYECIMEEIHEWFEFTDNGQE